MPNVIEKVKLITNAGSQVYPEIDPADHGAEVVANPTLAGTEPALTGVQINGSTFAVPNLTQPRAKLTNLFELFRDDPALGYNSFTFDETGHYIYVHHKSQDDADAIAQALLNNVDQRVFEQGSDNLLYMGIYYNPAYDYMENDWSKDMEVFNKAVMYCWCAYDYDGTTVTLHPGSAAMIMNFGVLWQSSITGAGAFDIGRVGLPMAFVPIAPIMFAQPKPFGTYYETTHWCWSLMSDELQKTIVSHLELVPTKV